MSKTSEIDRPSVHWMQIGFSATSVVFNLCLIAQLLTVGVAYFQDLAWWHIHALLVRGYSGLSLILLVWVFFTPFSRKIKRLTISLPILLGFQFASINFRSPAHLEILHPLVGFMLVYISSSLVHNVWRSFSPAALQSDLT